MQHDDAQHTNRPQWHQINIQFDGHDASERNAIAHLRRYGAMVATIVSAWMFGLAYGINVVLPAAIIIGVVNAVLYEKSGSIWPAVLTHGANNTIIFVLAAVLF